MFEPKIVGGTEHGDAESGGKRLLKAAIDIARGSRPPVEIKITREVLCSVMVGLQPIAWTKSDSDKATPEGWNIVGGDLCMASWCVSDMDEVIELLQVRADSGDEHAMRALVFHHMDEARRFADKLK